MSSDGSVRFLRESSKTVAYKGPGYKLWKAASEESAYYQTSEELEILREQSSLVAKRKKKGAVIMDQGAGYVSHPLKRLIFTDWATKADGAKLRSYCLRSTHWGLSAPTYAWTYREMRSRKLFAISSLVSNMLKRKASLDPSTMVLSECKNLIVPSTLSFTLALRCGSTTLRLQTNASKCCARS